MPGRISSPDMLSHSSRTVSKSSEASGSDRSDAFLFLCTPPASFVGS